MPLLGTGYWERKRQRNNAETALFSRDSLTFDHFDHNSAFGPTLDVLVFFCFEQSWVSLDPLIAGNTKLDFKLDFYKNCVVISCYPNQCKVQSHLIKMKKKIRTRQDRAEKLMSFTCGHPRQRLFKQEWINEKRLESVWAVSVEWLHFLSGLFTLTTKWKERKREWGGERNLLDGHSCPQAIFFIVQRAFCLYWW